MLLHWDREILKTAIRGTANQKKHAKKETPGILSFSHKPTPSHNWVLWVGLNRPGLGWIGLDRVGLCCLLGWIRSGWVGLDRVGSDWVG